MTRRAIELIYIDVVRSLVGAGTIFALILAALASKVNLAMAVLLLASATRDGAWMIMVALSERFPAERPRPSVGLVKILCLGLLSALAMTVVVEEQVGTAVKATILGLAAFAVLLACIRHAWFAVRAGSALPDLMLWGTILILLAVDTSLKVDFWVSLAGKRHLTIASPLQVPAVVIQGGGGFIGNHHFWFREQRYAVDMASYSHGENATADAAVIAPWGGRVAWIGHGEGDDPAGESLAIADGNGSFVMLAHLVRGSITVAVGDQVEVGQVMAAAGSTGNASIPHLHVQVQTTPDYHLGRTLPFAFTVQE